MVPETAECDLPGANAGKRSDEDSSSTTLVTTPESLISSTETGSEAEGEKTLAPERSSCASSEEVGEGMLKKANHLRALERGQSPMTGVTKERVKEHLQLLWDEKWTAAKYRLARESFEREAWCTRELLSKEVALAKQPMEVLVSASGTRLTTAGGTAGGTAREAKCFFKALYGGALGCASRPAVPSPTILRGAGVTGRNIHWKIAEVRDTLTWAADRKIGDVALTIDQEKAFDKIRHDFLFAELQKVGIDGALVNGIRALYKAPCSRVLINGAVSEPFEVQTGVRQGCPLSPLVYVVPFNAVLNKSAKVRLVQSLEDCSLLVANTGEITFYRPPVSSAIDVTLHTPDVPAHWEVGMDSWGSDHFPIDVTLAYKHQDPKRRTTIIVWDSFRASLDGTRASQDISKSSGQP
ncbi:uncharacterized protein LOC135392315 [Ornithodoros turicata]|uniref:uncharacterized protein LOC135392315 n=1 Tax=Ornithodoros turicata TaxID=34597 RepID=UPI00313A3490